ncbi:MAG: hypothetical protein ORN98_11520, partial [Alphaproteobacteria bacterium]|nr:hypothetical protein [Alphaproteobacteria bacterium]
MPLTNIPRQEIPGTQVEFDNSGAVSTLGGLPQRMVVMGWFDNTATTPGLATDRILTRVTSEADAHEKFGMGRAITNMIAAALRARPNVEIWAVGFADSGAKPTGNVQLTGNANAGEAVVLEIAGQRLPIILTAGAISSPSNIAAIRAAFNNYGMKLPVKLDTTIANGDVAATTVGQETKVTINLIARDPGTVGIVDIRISPDDQLPDGVIVKAITPMTGGVSPAPDLASLSSILGERWYASIVSPWTDTVSMTAIEIELTRRMSPAVALDMQSFVAVAGTSAALDTWKTTRNSPYVTSLQAGIVMRSPAYVLAAIVAAIDTMEPDPALPRKTLPIIGWTPPALKDRYSAAELNILLGIGMASYKVGDDNIARIERLVTGYIKDANGTRDPSYHDIETIRTLSFIRHDQSDVIERDFARFKLADNGTRFAPGQAIVTPDILRDAILARAIIWEQNGLIEDFDDFKSSLIVQRAADDVNA